MGYGLPPAGEPEPGYLNQGFPGAPMGPPPAYDHPPPAPIGARGGPGDLPAPMPNSEHMWCCFTACENNLYLCFIYRVEMSPCFCNCNACSKLKKVFHYGVLMIFIYVEYWKVRLLPSIFTFQRNFTMKNLRMYCSSFDTIHNDISIVFQNKGGGGVEWVWAAGEIDFTGISNSCIDKQTKETRHYNF